MWHGLAPGALLGVVVVVLVAASLLGYYEVTKTSTSSSTVYVTGVGVTGATDTFLTHCSVTGVGGFELQVVSDYMGATVKGETIDAVDTLGCQIVGQAAETQVVYLDNFSVGQGGWLAPVFPVQATPGGELNFTVSYKGATFNFTARVPPIGTACMTLHVPSGTVTASTLMNGSYCGSLSTSTLQSSNGRNAVSVSGLSLCASNCIYPAPHASALVTFNGTVPVSSLTVYVNGTYDGTAFENPSTATVACTTAAGQICSVELGGSGYSVGNSTTVTKTYATCSVPPGGTSCSATYTGSVNTLTVFGYEYKGSIPKSFIPAVPGEVYVFKFVATFQDGSTATASASTVAA